MALLIFSRDYFEQNGKTDKILLSKDDSIAYTLAMSTITTQLTSVTGWLLMCRAVQEGEVAIDDLADEDFRMPEFNLNVDASDSCFANLNKTVKDLLRRSCSLYNRIKRMENSISSKLAQNT